MFYKYSVPEQPDATGSTIDVEALLASFKQDPEIAAFQKRFGIVSPPLILEGPAGRVLQMKSHVLDDDEATEPTLSLTLSPEASTEEMTADIRNALKRLLYELVNVRDLSPGARGYNEKAKMFTKNEGEKSRPDDEAMIAYAVRRYEGGADLLYRANTLDRHPEDPDAVEQESDPPNVRSSRFNELLNRRTEIRSELDNAGKIVAYWWNGTDLHYIHERVDPMHAPELTEPRSVPRIVAKQSLLESLSDDVRERIQMTDREEDANELTADDNNPNRIFEGSYKPLPLFITTNRYGILSEEKAMEIIRVEEALQSATKKGSDIDVLLEPVSDAVTIRHEEDERDEGSLTWKVRWFERRPPEKKVVTGNMVDTPVPETDHATLGKKLMSDLEIILDPHVFETLVTRPHEVEGQQPYSVCELVWSKQDGNFATSSVQLLSERLAELVPLEDTGVLHEIALHVMSTADFTPDQVCVKIQVALMK